MSRYVAIFPIHGNPPEQRLHRAALNQLANLVPDTITITGPWTGHTWTDPDHHHWYIMTAPAEGTTDEAALETIRATAHHIDPQLTAWIDGTAWDDIDHDDHPYQGVDIRATQEERLDELAFLIDAGTPVHEAVARAGFPSMHSAERAAHRAGRGGLASTVYRAVA